MSLLSASQLAYRPAAMPAALFSDVSFDLHPGERVALVGPNGAGKTTLLRLVAGELAPDRGRLVRRSGLVVGAVAQQPTAPAGASVLGYVAAAAPPEEAWQAARVLTGLGFAPALHDHPFATLSAGQRTRAALARLLVQPAELLLLDEPTNHLDAAARAWLEGWLVRQDLAMLIASHERAFLAATAQRVLALRDGALTAYEGGYQAFRDAQALAERQAWAAFAGQQRRFEAAQRAAEGRMALARDVAKTPPGIRLGKDFYNAKAAKVAKTAKAIEARAAREREAPKPVIEAAVPVFDWGEVPRAAGLALSVRGLAKAFGDRALFTDLSFELARGERLAIAGANGAGKTTLLRILLGREPADAGELSWGPGVVPGFFGQEGEQLDMAASALDNVLAGAAGSTGPTVSTGSAGLAGAADAADPARARLLLACLRLRGERAFQPVGTMSAGERAKVALARLLLGGANVLVLDEPTNHLDLDAREAMEQTLAGYPGAIVLVSHDRRFAEAIAPRRLTLGAPARGGPPR